MLIKTKFGELNQLIIVIVISLQWSASFADSSQAETILTQHDLSDVKIYDQLKEKYINNTDPLLIAQGDQFILYHKGKVVNYPIFSQKYNDLKSVSHVTLATFALFNPLNHFPRNKKEVVQYKQLLLDTEKVIDQLPLSKDQKERQEKILLLTNQFIQKAFQKNSCSNAELEQFFQEIAPLIRQNMSDAVQAELKVLNQQMNKIEQQLTNIEQKNLFVVIPVSKAPRKDNLLGQYFSKRLNVPMESARLIFAEGLTDTNAILTLVGSWQTEADLSRLFFHNPNSMKRDILGEDAKQLL